MADRVETAIYKLSVAGEEEVDALAASLGRLGAAEDKAAASGAKITTVHERLSRATRTTPDSYDKMMGRLDPLVRAEQQHAAALAQVHRLQEEGAISSQQATAAVTAATSRYATAVQRLKGTRAEGVFLGAAEGARLSAFQTQNMAFQIQDVATMLASGQNPFVTIMQQGLQIVGIMGEGNRSVVGAMKAVGASIMSFISNPLTLTVIAIAVAAGAVKLLFDAISGGGKSAEETLKAQEDLLKRIKDRFGEVDGAAKRYQETLDSLQFTQRGVANELATTLRGQMSSTWKELDAEINSIFGRAFNPNLEKLFEATAKFVDEARAGRGDILAFNEEIAQIANSDAADKRLQRWARRLVEVAKEATETAKAIRDLNSTTLQFQGPGGLFLGNVRRSVGDQTIDISGAEKDMANYAKVVNETAVSIDRLNEAHAAELDAIGAKSPAQRQAAAETQERISLIGQEITQEEKTARIAQAGALARASAEYELSEAARQRLMGMEETVAAAELEIRLIGESVGEAARLKTEFQLLETAKKAAFESGTIVSDAEIAAIKEAAAALGELNQQLAETQKLSDLQFDASQMFRSGTEQKVASTLRDLYGDDWQANADGAIAKQIRFNALLGDAGKAAQQIGSDLVESLTEGEGIVKSIAGALGGAVSGLSGTIGSAASGLIGKLTGGAGGFLSGILGNLGGGLVSGLVSSLGGIVSEIFANPELDAWRGMKEELGGFVGELKRGDISLEQAKEQYKTLMDAAEAAGQSGARVERLTEAFKAFQKEAKKEEERAKQAKRDAKTAASLGRIGGFQDRAFIAGLDTSTLEGQLARFDLEAQREREELARTAGKKYNKEVIALDKALAAERLQIQQDFNDQIVEEAKRAQEEINRAAQSILDYVNSLNTGSDSPLSPIDQLIAAQTTYSSQLALAQGGNVDAQSSITQYADAYLKAAREMYASSETFQNIFNAVKTDLLGLPAISQTDDPVAQALADILIVQQNLLNATGTLQSAVTDTTSAVFGTTSAIGGTTSAIFGTTSAVVGQLPTLGAIQTATTNTVSEVSPLEQKLTDVNSTLGTLNASLDSLTSSVDLLTTNIRNIAGYEDKGTWKPIKGLLKEIASNTGKKPKTKLPKDDPLPPYLDPAYDPNTNNRFGGVIPSARFASGGIIGNGTWNVDSVIARYANGGDTVALAGGEFVTRAPSVNAMTMPILDAINRTGRAPQVDNGKHFADLMRVNLASTRALIETLQSEIAMLRAEVRRTGEGTTRAVKDKPVAKPATKVA